MVFFAIYILGAMVWLFLMGYMDEDEGQLFAPVWPVALPTILVLFLAKAVYNWGYGVGRKRRRW